MGAPPYGALVSSTGTLTQLDLGDPLTINGVMTQSVSMNSSGVSLVGGQQKVQLSGIKPAFAAFVSPSGAVTPLVMPGLLAQHGIINSVAINNSGNGIIGGRDTTGPMYAVLVSTSTNTPIPLTFPPIVAAGGVILSVAINDSGTSLVGGGALSGALPGYAALVTPSGTVNTLTLTGGIATTGEIASVAINNSGNGIIGGWDLIGTQPGYAALFTSSGTVIPLTLTGGIATNGWINKGAVSLMGGIPTASLSGNNLVFANYINEFAPDDAFYFIPSELDGTLNAALESTAPTRNGVSIYTASNNLFYVSTSFASHIRIQQTETLRQPLQPVAIAEEALIPHDELLASISLQKKTQKKDLPKPKEKSYSLWFDVIGAWAHQKPQHQTVGFDPITGGLILAFDGRVTPQVRVGGGVSYLYTHIHEREDQGHSNINQEDAFLYSSWDNQKFYVDLLVLGGALQIDQVRKKNDRFFLPLHLPSAWMATPTSFGIRI